MTARIIWLITSVVGIAAVAIYMALVWAQLRFAFKSRFSLQLPQLWGQFAAGGILGIRFILTTMLGIWAIIESPLAQQYGVVILSLGNVLTVLALVILIVALNWTVLEDDEEDASVEEELRTGEFRPGPASKAITKDNPLPVEVIDTLPVVELDLPAVIVSKPVDEEEKASPPS